MALYENGLRGSKHYLKKFVSSPCGRWQRWHTAGQAGKVPGLGKGENRRAKQKGTG